MPNVGVANFHTLAEGVMLREGAIAASWLLLLPSLMTPACFAACPFIRRGVQLPKLAVWHGLRFIGEPEDGGFAGSQPRSEQEGEF